MDEDADPQGIDDLSLNQGNTNSEGDDSEGSSDDGSAHEEDDVDVEDEDDGDDDTENDDSADDDHEEYRLEQVVHNVTDVDFSSLSPSDVKEMVFADVEVAYAFYNQYAKLNGFSVRKNKRGKNKNRDITWQQFVCSCEGFRHMKYMNMPNRQREHRVLTRCGCEAEMRVGLDVHSDRWYVNRFCDDHNHQLLGDKYYGLLRSHRKISDADFAQVESMRKSGISIPNIYGSFASHSGGYHMVGFRTKELYNRLQKERRLHESDVKQVVRFLRELRAEDRTLFWSHKVGPDRRLLQLFWCDGMCQVDYEVFGDVLAFDATYGRNKYKCPVVVFSGVNHHKQTCVFACGIVSDEKEETYVWLLEQFLQAMKGKSPRCVITDGDLAMRNAIAIVFPEAHHRLCGWHLIRNVTANVGDIRFTQLFKRCMLSNFDVNEFEDRWEAAVEECGLRDNEWVHQLYEKKLMWATAHIKGKFFAGMRTTSRCESLHAHMGRYVHSRFRLSEFVYHFQRCVEYIRSKEIEADFKSAYGFPVMQTEFVYLERFGAATYTRELFSMFRQRLLKSISLDVLDCIENATSKIFIVSKYCSPRLKWHVSLYPRDFQVRCSCLGMESDGIPCVHIIRVLVLLDFDHLPKCLVLDRWTRTAKAGVERSFFHGSMTGNIALYNGRYTALLDSCRRLCTYATKNYEDFNDIRDKIAYELQQLQSKNDHNILDDGHEAEDNFVGSVAEPVAAGGQTCDDAPIGSGQKCRKRVRCGCCKALGHTRKTCTHARRIGQILSSDVANTSSGH